MGARALLSFTLAVLAAAGNAVANVMQRKASLEEPADRRFGAALLADLLTRASWLLGFGAMVASFELQALALSYGQLSTVETVITLEVPLTILLAARVFGANVGRIGWIGIAIMTVGMVGLIASLNPRPGNETDVSHTTYAIAGGATAATIVGLVLMSRRGGRLWRTATLGAAAGTSFGLTATFIKETVAQFSAHGLVGVVTTWQTYAAVGFGALGIVLVQWALHTGPLAAAQPGFTLLDPLVSILWGVLVYHEGTRTGIWLVPAAAAGIAIGVGVAVLARSPLLATLDDDEPARHPVATTPGRLGLDQDEYRDPDGREHDHGANDPSTGGIAATP